MPRRKMILVYADNYMLVKPQFFDIKEGKPHSYHYLLGVDNNINY